MGYGDAPTSAFFNGALFGRPVDLQNGEKQRVCLQSLGRSLNGIEDGFVCVSVLLNLDFAGCRPCSCRRVHDGIRAAGRHRDKRHHRVERRPHHAPSQHLAWVTFNLDDAYLDGQRVTVAAISSISQAACGQQPQPAIMSGISLLRTSAMFDSCA